MVGDGDEASSLGVGSAPGGAAGDDAAPAVPAANKGPRVIVEIIGSRPINYSILGILLAMVVGVLYTIIVVGTSVQLCGSQIQNFAENPWYEILDSKDGNMSTVGFSDFLMRQTIYSGLSIDELADGQDGMVPQCAICSKSNLVDLNTALLDSLPYEFASVPNSSLLENSTFQTDHINDAEELLLPIIVFVLSAVAMQEDVGGVWGCLWSLALELSAALEQSLFYPFSGVEPTSIECLAGARDDSSCYPCGDLNAMGLELLESGDDGVLIFRDVASQRIFNSSSMYAVATRCARLVTDAFLEPCRVGDDLSDENSYVNIFGKARSREAPASLHPVSQLWEEDQQQAEALQLRKIATTRASAEVDLPSSSNAAVILAHALSFVQSGFVVGELNTLIDTFKRDLLNGNATFETLTSTCAELPSAQSLFAFEVDSPFRAQENEDIVARVERWESWSICWASMLYYYWKTPSCFETMTGAAFASNETLAEEVQVSLIFMTLVGSWLDEPGVSRLPDTATFGDGFPLANISDAWALLDNVTENIPGFGSDGFPITQKDFQNRSQECNARLSAAARELKDAVGFLEQMNKCDAPARQIQATMVVDLIGWFIGLLALFLQFFWIIRGHRTQFSWAMVALTVTGICICDNGAFYFETFGWSANEFKLSIFFNTPATSVQQQDYVSAMRSLAIASFFFFHALTMLQLGRSPSPAPKASGPARWAAMLPPRSALAFGLALAYFLFRVCIVVLVLGTHAGLVPLVNIITVFRVCALDETLPMPYCSSPDVDPSTAKKAFAGNFVVFFLDLVLLVYTAHINANTRALIRGITFSQARDRHLVYNLEMLFMWFLLAALYVCGIIYVSMADVLVGYDGYYKFEGGEVRVENVSVQSTGVDAWDMGFTILIWVFCVGWTFLMVPVSSSSGRLFARAFKTIGKRVEFFGSEKDAVTALAPRGTTEKMSSEVVMDETVFITETHLVNFEVTHTTYHIGAVFASGQQVLPANFRELAYITDASTDTHVWIVAAGDRLLIGFRGTTSKRNAQTDLRMGFKTLAWHAAPRAALETIKSSPAAKLAHSAQSESGPDFASTATGSDPAAATKAELSSTPAKSAPGWRKDGQGSRAPAALDRANKALLVFTEGSRAPKIHGGFLLAFHSVQDRILETVLEHLEENAGVDKIFVSGHSLGGALATVCGLFLATALPAKRTLVQVSTFGSPRVGNHTFKSFFQQHVRSCWRFAKRGDPISKTPPRLYGSQRHGYTHVGVEVLLEQSGDAIIDPSVVEHAILHGCRNGGGADHKVSAYLASLLGFALMAESHGERRIAPLWPNCEERIRQHAKLISSVFPRTSQAILSFVGDAAPDDDGEQRAMREATRALEATESGRSLFEDASSELMKQGFEACRDEDEGGTVSAASAPARSQDMTRELDVV